MDILYIRNIHGEFSPIFFDTIEDVPYMKYTNVFFINAFDEWKGVVVSMAYMPVVLFLIYSLLKEK